MSELTPVATEQWRPVVGYEGLYEVSNFGRVKSLGRLTRNRNGVVRLKPRILKLRVKQSGHVTVCLYRDGKPTNVSVHRAVLIAFVGHPSDGKEACHNNGIPSDNRLENLRWDTRKSNKRDEVEHGANYQSAKTHCDYGHEFSPENTYLYRGGRHCRQCARRRLAKHRGTSHE